MKHTGTTGIAPDAVRALGVRPRAAQPEERESAEQAEEHRDEDDVREELLVGARQRQNRRPDREADDGHVRSVVLRVHGRGGRKEHAVRGHRVEAGVTPREWRPHPRPAWTPVP